MTAQVPGSPTMGGRRWATQAWVGDHSGVPGNDGFGIVTGGPTTNKGSGRIDHVMVLQGRLHLFKPEVTLAPDFDRAGLSSRRREVLCRYEPVRRRALVRALQWPSVR